MNYGRQDNREVRIWVYHSAFHFCTIGFASTACCSSEVTVRLPISFVYIVDIPVVLVNGKRCTGIAATTVRLPMSLRLACQPHPAASVKHEDIRQPGQEGGARMGVHQRWRTSVLSRAQFPRLVPASSCISSTEIWFGKCARPERSSATEIELRGCCSRSNNEKGGQTARVPLAFVQRSRREISILWLELWTWLCVRVRWWGGRS